MQKNEDKYYRNRKILFIAGGAVLVLAVMAFYIYMVIEAPKTGTLEIGIAPKDATIIIGDKEYKNGSYKMIPGDYTASVTKDEYNGFTGAITITDGGTTQLRLCLARTDGEPRNLDEEEKKICFAATEYEESEVNKQRYSDEVFKYIPYRSYENGFAISGEKADSEDTIVLRIVTMTCLEFREMDLQEKARAYLRERGIDLSKYYITYESSCNKSK